MGYSLHDLRRRSSAAHPAVRLRALPGCVAAGSDSGVLSGRQAARTGHCGIAGKEKTAGVVHTGGRGRTVGVWVLF